MEKQNNVVCNFNVTSGGIFSDLYETHIEQAVYFLWGSHGFQPNTFYSKSTLLEE